MKKYILCFAAAYGFFCATSASADEIRLPKVNIAGQEYYVYEIKKGDSLYGISNRFGWNFDRLSQLNPSQSLKLEKGAKLYFPVSGDAADSTLESSGFVLPETYPVIRHIVKKGDSVYSIAKMYGVPVDVVYSYNPDSKNGIRRGSVITIPQQAGSINDGSSFYYYTIRPGDTLNDIAAAYNTSLQNLMADNKGLSENTFAVGDLLRVRVNSNKDNLVRETVEETKLDHLDSYKASNDDTWETVSDKTGVGVEELLEANAGTQLKKNATLAVPVKVTSQVEKEVEVSDERENTPEGRMDIYKEVHLIGTPDSVSGLNSEVSVALLIEDPKSKRDNEFTRGALLALDGLKKSPYKINFKVLHDNKADSDSAKVTKRLTGELDDFNADLIVATYERNFPVWLAQYGERNGVEIINAFDVKNELYLENPSIIHLLTPSPYFTEEVAEWVDSSLGGYRLVMVGKEDPEDAFATEIIERRGSGNVMFLTVDGLSEMKLGDDDEYLFYGYPTGRDEVGAMLNAIDLLKENNPLARIKVLGRPSWITLADAMKEQFAGADVYFPSRFYFDHTGNSGKDFIATYSSAYGHGPIRSYPTYAVAGYDIMNYFVPGLAANNGDFNAAIPEGKELQTPINLQRVGNWGGFFNPSAYIIRYNPYGEVEKILIRK